MPAALEPHARSVLCNGMTICGLACDDGDLAIGDSSYLHNWLHRKTTSLLAELDMLQSLPSMIDPTDCGLQVGCHLLKQLWPSKVIHLMRAYSFEVLEPYLELLQDRLNSSLRTWIKAADLRAVHFDIAKLPVPLGGLGWPDLLRDAPIQ